MSWCGLSCNLEMLPPTSARAAPLLEVADVNTRSVIRNIQPDVLV